MRFSISYTTGGYRVSVPNYDGGVVVTADEHDAGVQASAKVIKELAERNYELERTLRRKDVILEKMRAEFAEYKKNKNMEKDEILTAKQAIADKNARLFGKVYELKKELRQRERDDAQTPWYSELKKYSKSLETQVYNLNTDNTRLQVAIDSLTKVAGQRLKEYDEQRRLTQNAEAVLSQVRAQREWLQKTFFQKNLLFIRARNVITAFEREIKKVDPFLWDRCLNNPELPELKQYLATKEKYYAERKRKLAEGYQPEHQDRASSGQTGEAGYSYSGVAGGQVQTKAEAQEVNQQVAASKKSFAGILSTSRAREVFDRKYYRSLDPGVYPAGVVAKVRAHAESKTPYLKVKTLNEALADGQAKMLNVPIDSDYIRRADVLIAIKDGQAHVVKNRFYTDTTGAATWTK